MTLQIRPRGGAVTVPTLVRSRAAASIAATCACAGERRLGLGKVGDAPGDVAPQLVPAAVVPVWVGAVAGHEHPLLGGGAADLQLGDTALPLDSLQLELRHRRQRGIGGSDARIAARRKTLHAVTRRPGNGQPLLDLLELEPRRSQGYF